MKRNNNSFTWEHIWSWTITYLVDSFKDCTWKKEIQLDAQGTGHCLVLVDWTTSLEYILSSRAEEATVHVYALLLWKQGTKIDVTFHAHLLHNKSTAHLHLITFLPTWSNVHVDGGVTIHPHVSKCSWHLLEENIILGEWVQIKTLPMLEVQSNDVSASHGARIEKLDAKKLFYAQSRGLSESEAKWLLVHGYFHQCFAPFIEQDMTIESLQEFLYTDLLSR